jgi:hypothetical protein
MPAQPQLAERQQQALQRSPARGPKMSGQRTLKPTLAARLQSLSSFAVVVLPLFDLRRR